MLMICLGIALTGISAGICWGVNRKMNRRFQALERDMKRVSEAMTQMADLQMKTHQKLSARFEDIEERMMELSVPSNDAELPLERRHQVLALDRQGVPVQEIAKRIKAPVGEAELILNLRKYRGGEGLPAGKSFGRAGQYV